MRSTALIAVALSGTGYAALLSMPQLQSRPMQSSPRVSPVCMGSTNDFKVGLTIEFDGGVWKVQEFLHVKPGKGSAFVRSKLKNLENGNVLEKTWRAGENVDAAQVDREEMQFSYIDGDSHVFMNMETFEEERILSDDIDKKEFIKEDLSLTVLKWQGKCIDVQVPQTMSLKVVETEPGAKGNTAQGRAEKPATLETGAVINVPIFINEGETVKVDTDTRKYMGRDTSS